MKPQPEYRAYLYPSASSVMREFDPESEIGLQYLSFFFEPVLPKTYRYACGKCRIVVPEGYFSSSPFRIDQDLPEDVMTEIAGHAKAHQIIGAAERRGFALVPVEDMKRLSAELDAGTK